MLKTLTYTAYKTNYISQIESYLKVNNLSNTCDRGLIT